MNRSGSTYLSHILSRSQEIAVCPEGEALSDLLLTRPEQKVEKDLKKKLRHLFHHDPKLRLWPYDDKEMTEVLSASSNQLEVFLRILEWQARRIKPAATWVLFKAERLADLFPDLMSLSSRKGYPLEYMAIIRDVRGVYASQQETLFPGTDRPMSSHAVFTALFWKRYLKRIRSIGEKVHILHYEDLLRQPDVLLEQLFRLLEVNPFDPFSGEGDLFDRLPDDHKKIHSLTTDVPDVRRIDRWKETLRPHEKTTLFLLCQHELKREGYRPEKPRFTLKGDIYLTLGIIQYLCHRLYKKFADFFITHTHKRGLS